MNYFPVFTIYLWLIFVSLFTFRAIQLFGLELQKLKSRMKSETAKRSSEIVMSVSDGIYLQLQNLESHIQTDV